MCVCVHIHGFYVHTYVQYIDFMCMPVCTESGSPALQTDSLLSEPLEKPYIYIIYMYVWLQRVLAATYRIFCCGVWASPLVLYGLQSVDSRASCLVAWPGIKPRSSALQGRFLTIRPPDLYSLFMKGKAKVVFNWKKRFQGNTSLF